jgi:opine dehydrogenase
MKVTIVGGGNMGLAMVGYMVAHQKAQVTLFSTKDPLREGAMLVEDIEGKKSTYVSKFVVTDNPEAAFQDADLIFVTYPAFLKKDFVVRYERFISRNCYLGFVPGYGGAEYACTNLIQKGVTIFGLQRVPYVARFTEKDGVYKAGILSKKKTINTATIPDSKSETVRQLLEELLDIPAKALKEYLSITLAPSNPLLHITGLYHVFKDYHEGMYYERPLKLYEEWDNDTSEMLFRYDAELQEVCNALKPFDLQEVVPLPVYYESDTPEKMTRKLKSIAPFKSVLVPLIKSSNGYIPDLNSRMFREDYPFGVCVIKDFAKMTGVATPTVDRLLEFYKKLSGHQYFYKDGSYTSEIKNTGIPENYGLFSIEQIVKFYHH